MSVQSQSWTALKVQDSLSASEKQRLVVLCYESMEYWYNDAIALREANGKLNTLVRLKDIEINQLSKDNADLKRSNDILDKKVGRFRRLSFVTSAISAGIITLVIVVGLQ